jgi:uncharacterized OB-fold protein
VTRHADDIGGPRRQRPAVTADLAFWWDGLSQRELRIQRCLACGAVRHPPQIRCPACGSLDSGWTVATGTGTVHSKVVYHYPLLPDTEYPYVVGLVDLAEGVRVVLPILEDNPSLGMGDAVIVEWTTDNDGLGWPFARRSEP